MSAGAGSLEITARRSGARTVLERVRYDGIARCSRAFAHGDAALVVLSQLGPGVVRGDRTTLRGTVRAQAHLIVTAQTATRVLGGERASSAISQWSVEAGARLEIVAEPVIAAADARYEARSTIELNTGSRAVLSDIFCVPLTASVRLTTVVRRAGSEIFYDAVEAGACAGATVGTLIVVEPDAQLAATIVAALDRGVDRFADVDAGVGTPACGAFVRVVGNDVWAVRAALSALRTTIAAQLTLTAA